MDFTLYANIMAVRSACGHGTSGGTSETERDTSMDEPKIIHTQTFSCADDHPIVYYTFDKNNKAMCEYCATHFVYEPTPSEEMQNNLEPINNYVNKILKGSG
jgi:uncharacterized Zn-finger protein